MHCPDCGCEIDLEIDFCPVCGSDFSELSYAQKKLVFNRPLKSERIRTSAVVDSSNVNGYVVYEGTSIRGGKLKKGASSSRNQSAVVGYDVNTAVRKEFMRENRLIIKGNPSKRDNETKKRD